MYIILGIAIFAAAFLILGIAAKISEQRRLRAYLSR